MISPSASMPIVCIFERHWDVSTKQVLKKLISNLSEESYDTLCFESPQDLEEQQCLSLHEMELKEDEDFYKQAKNLIPSIIQVDDLSTLKVKELMGLVRLFVSDQDYRFVTEKIKNLPASRLMKEIFSETLKRSWTIKGVDINANEFAAILSADLINGDRLKEIEKKEERRIKTITDNLVKLSQEKKGIIFSCGSLHAKKLLKSLEEKGLKDRVLYYFPHSNEMYNSKGNDIEKLIAINDVLKDHRYCLLTEKDQQALVEKIVREVKSKNTQYKKEIVGGNFQSAFLSEFFQVDFKAFMRPGYYVDILLEINETNKIQAVSEAMRQANIPTQTLSFLEKKYLVIANVNTKEIAERIYHLKHLPKYI